MVLSPHFTLQELSYSSTAIRKGISNIPSSIEIENLTALCHQLLEPLRADLDRPIKITSGYRCEKLNKLIGGAKNSQHIEGKAADIRVEGISTEELFQLIKDTYDYDQLIQEFDS